MFCLNRSALVLLIAVVAAFCLLAVYGKNPILGVAVVILGIGHIGIHWMHKKEIEEEQEKQR